MSSESQILVRQLDELDISAVVSIDERIGGAYRPEVWERRISYHLRRDPETALVAEHLGEVVGFMLGDVRSGEFGLEEPTGWIEVVGVDPRSRGLKIGRRLAEEMFARFRARGAGKVRTLVENDREELVKFFDSVGFEPAKLTALVRTI
ncbi:MAG TPA: GNAT family N-acetyltransferase [Thermoanaerobaculia bacterium]|jgi:ribosomal protein S18 acetylase RimI-like enzyme|nr:GNAT family N-acetyltransferase [Thermoanaerobaculia bacterium]